MKIDIKTGIISESAANKKDKDLLEAIGFLLIGDPEQFGTALAKFEKRKRHFRTENSNAKILSDPLLTDHVLNMVTKANFWKAFYSISKGNQSYGVDIEEYEDEIASKGIKVSPEFLEGASSSALSSYAYAILAEEEPVLKTRYGFKGNINSFFNKYVNRMNFSKYSDDEAIIAMLEDSASDLGITLKTSKAILSKISSRTIKQNQESVDYILGE